MVSLTQQVEIKAGLNFIWMFHPPFPNLQLSLSLFLRSCAQAQSGGMLIQGTEQPKANSTNAPTWCVTMYPWTSWRWRRSRFVSSLASSASYIAAHLNTANLSPDRPIHLSVLCSAVISLIPPANPGASPLPSIYFPPCPPRPTCNAT